MACPHPDTDCEDCLEHVACKQLCKRPAALPRTDCDRCRVARAAAAFILALSDQEGLEALASGDMNSGEWDALHADLLKGAGA